MTKYFFILLFLFAGQIFGQKADTVKFDRIFGTHCPDSITNPLDKGRQYALKWKDHERFITAYKSKKEKWSYSIGDLVYLGDNNINIKCIEFYEINKKMVIRLFLDSSILRGDKQIYHVDIDPKSGKPIDKTLAKK